MKVGLDTNVLVRYIMQDDARQAALATRVVESLTPQAPGFIALVSVAELAWVLQGAYGLNRSQLSAALSSLLRTPEFIVQDAQTVWQALRAFEGGKADFADCLIERAAAAAGCAQTLTFDRAAARTGGMTLVS